MGSESAQSYIDSQEDDDYMVRGINWHKDGDISHFPANEQAIIKRQRLRAKEQGGIKYIGPVKGKKLQTEVNPDMYRFVQRRAYCPVEIFKMHKHTREYLGIEKLTQFENMISAEEEMNQKVERQYKKLQDEKEGHDRKIKSLKFQADQLQRCRENGNLVGCRKVEQCAEEMFVLEKWQNEDDAIQ